MEMVSVVITTHNRLVLLKRAINSVFAQTYGDIECIVVSDASTDETNEYCNKLPLRLIAISKEDSKGGNHARNLGILASTGSYVAFLDDDDYWMPEKIAKQVALIKSKRCEVVYCGRTLELVNDNVIKYKESTINSRNQGDLSKRILQTVLCTTSCILAKRDALIAIGLFDERLSFWQETELLIRLAQREAIYFIDEPLCVYRKNISDKNRLSNKHYEWVDAIKYIHKKHASLYAQLSVYERFLSWMTVISDAKNRSRNAGLCTRYFLYCALYSILNFPFSVVNFIQQFIAKHIVREKSGGGNTLYVNALRTTKELWRICA